MIKWPKTRRVPDNDVTHRISIVKFADDSYADSVGNDRQDDYYAYNYTQIVKDFTTVDAAGVQQLTGAIEALKPPAPPA